MRWHGACKRHLAPVTFAAYSMSQGLQTRTPIFPGERPVTAGCPPRHTEIKEQPMNGHASYRVEFRAGNLHNLAFGGL